VGRPRGARRPRGNDAPAVRVIPQSVLPASFGRSSNPPYCRGTPPRVHREQAARHPCQRDQAEQQSDYVMPSPQSATGRVDLPEARAWQAVEADPYAGNGKEAADQCSPHQHPASQGSILPKDRRIKPVRHGAEPAPEPSNRVVCWTISPQWPGTTVKLKPQRDQIGSGNMSSATSTGISR